MFQDVNQTANEIYIGPKAVVLCSSHKKVRKVFNQAQLLTNGQEFPRVTYLDIECEAKSTASILNGCEILISAPSPLRRLIESGVS